MSQRRRRTYSRFQQLLRSLIFGLIRLFYPRIEILGAEKLPEGGAVLVANHPNGLIDPAVIIVGLAWDLAFLAKSTFFGNPAGQFIMDTFGALPIYRWRDVRPGSERETGIRDLNEETFTACRNLLHRGQGLALFPEGTTHSNTQLLPLRSGAARIALGAASEGRWREDIFIVPVGLWYEAKTIFRSSVLIVIGEPIPVRPYQARFEEDPFLAARAVTRRIRHALDAVVLQAEDAEILRAIPTIAGWIAPLPEAGDMKSQYAWSKRLLAAYRVLRRRRPELMENLAADLRYYANSLRRLGLKRPFSPASFRDDVGRISRLFLWLVVTFPVALAGFITTFPTYRLARPFAHMITARDRTQISTAKILGGMLFVLIGWLVEAAVLGSWAGAAWGWLFLVVAPACAFTSLRWGEQAESLAEIIIRHRRQILSPNRLERLREQRHHLALTILAAVEEAEAMSASGSQPAD